MVFVDTSAWFALFVPSDPRHEDVVRWVDAREDEFVTTDYCVDETLTLLVARRRRKLALEVGQVLFNESLARLLFLSPAQIQKAWILFQQRSNAGWSFTDCTSAVMMTDMKIGKALALDDHFREFANAEIVP